MLHVVQSTAPATDVETLVETILTELHGVIREVRCGSTERLVHQQLSMTQLHVLWLLEHNGSLSMSRVAEFLDVSLSNATGLIDRMEERGLVVRVRVPDDRRLVLVRPAAGGRLALEEADGIRRDRMRSVLGRLEPAQLARLAAAIRDVRGALGPELGLAKHVHHFVDTVD